MSNSPKRLISFIMTVAIMICSVVALPLFTPKDNVYAASSIKNLYNLISSSTTSDVLGCGEWNSSTKTLTLSGISYSTSVAFNENSVNGVKVPDGSTIVIEGTNSILLDNTSCGAVYALYCRGSLTLTGSGILNVIVSGNGICRGIYQDIPGSMTIGCGISIGAISPNSNKLAIETANTSNIVFADYLISDGGIVNSVGTHQEVVVPFALTHIAPLPIPTPMNVDYASPVYFVFTPKCSGGSITMPLSKRFTEVGREVILSIEPEKGYVFKDINVIAYGTENIPKILTTGLTAKITMPHSNIYVSATFDTVDEMYSSFVDLEPKAWYKKSVCFCLEKAWFRGCGGGIFRPNDIITEYELSIVQENMGESIRLMDLVNGNILTRVELCELLMSYFNGK